MPSKNLSFIHPSGHGEGIESAATHPRVKELAERYETPFRAGRSRVLSAKVEAHLQKIGFY